MSGKLTLTMEDLGTKKALLSINVIEFPFAFLPGTGKRNAFRKVEINILNNLMISLAQIPCLMIQ